MKTLLAKPECGLRETAWLKVGKCEQHAAFVGEFDRLSGDDDQLAGAIGKGKLRLHLRNGAPLGQAFVRHLSLLCLGEQVDLIHRPPDDLLALEPGHVEKPLVDLDELEITKTANDRRGGVCVEGLVEALLSLRAFGHVEHDQHQAVRRAVAVDQHQAADLVNPTRVLNPCVNDLDGHFAEGLARNDAIYRIISNSDRVVVTITQREPLAIFADCVAELRERRDPVHLQGGLVRPDDALIGVNQDHALGQSGHDQSQIAQIGGVADADHWSIELFVHGRNPFLRLVVGRAIGNLPVSNSSKPK